MPVVYSAVKRFDSGCGEAWGKFIEWSGLTQLQEVVSLDLILCSTVFGELTDEDWGHNVQEDFKITLFHDLDHVLRRVAGDDRTNVLALMQNPTDDEIRSFSDPRFVLRGFDLVELQTGISALVNCGGFDKAFAPTELSDCVFSDDDRRRYVEGLAAVVKPGGRLFLVCFSDDEPGEQGPRRVSRKEIEVAFAEGWTVESIEPSRFEVRPDLKDITFSEGGPKAWFVVVRRGGAGGS